MSVSFSHRRLALPLIGLAAALAASPAMAGSVAQDNRSPVGTEYAPSISDPTEQGKPVAEPSAAADASRFDIFKPTDTPVRHRITYDIWSFALEKMVVSMGPSTRQTAPAAYQKTGSRIRVGHKSRYRLEGALMGFYFMDERAVSSFGEYRRELEQVADTLDISSIPRNEQLAFWFNLHNVAMVEKIAESWPIRQPRKLMVDGVPLNDAKFITVRGVSMSPRDIREKIVYANWRDPKVIYGFWLGEIGAPALERIAFDGSNVSSLLALKAEDFVNSLRGTQKFGSTLHVSTFFEDVAPFYFADFEQDARAHIAEYANDEVKEILANTTKTKASIRDWDIADLNGGRRDSIATSAVAGAPGGVKVPAGIAVLMGQRQRKLELLKRKGERTGRVFFSEFVMPDEDPNKGQVE